MNEQVNTCLDCGHVDGHLLGCPSEMKPWPCPRCNAAARVETNGLSWGVSCPECYDGAPDSATRHEFGNGIMRREAIERWNQRIHDEEWP